jgi:multidrug resistance efflux pump
LKNQVVVKEDEIKVKEAALQSANFALKTAEINQRQAKLDYDRALTLRDSRAISQANFETAETAFKKAEMEVQNAHADIINAQAQLKQSRSNLAIAKKNLDDSIIRAPFDCVVFETYVEENEYVTAGKNIMKLENPDKFEIVCYIGAVYFDRLEVGKTAVEFVDSKGKIVGVVGGDHSVTFGAVRSISSVYPQMGVLFIDAHSDLRPSGKIFD